MWRPLSSFFVPHKFKTYFSDQVHTACPPQLIIFVIFFVGGARGAKNQSRSFGVSHAAKGME